MIAMNTASYLQALLVDIVHEHRELQRRLLELRRMVRDQESGRSNAERLSSLCRSLADLRKRMQAHFAQEETGEVMEEAVIRIPRLARDAAKIEREHPELIRRIDNAIRLSETTDPVAEDWHNASETVEALVTQMLAHEEAENHLLQQVFHEQVDNLQ
jgi:hypothetical protein